MDDNTCVHNYKTFTFTFFHKEPISIRRCSSCGYIEGIGYIKKGQDLELAAKELYEKTHKNF